MLHSTAVCSRINQEIADRFDEMACLLEARLATDFRIRAYRRGAAVLRELLPSVVSIYDDSGRRGLEEITGIGQSLAFAIERYMQSGRIPMLRQLRRTGPCGPEITAVAERSQSLLTRKRMKEARDRATTPETSPTAAVAGRLQRTHRDDARHDEPPVAELLAIDAEYRSRSAADELLRIAPRQFNPTGQAWLPLLHTQRDTRHYTVVFSNTAQAHQLGMTHDWVIIRRRDRRYGRQWTVITARRGLLSGSRIVRGREDECHRFFAGHPGQVEPSERFVSEGEARQLSLFDRPLEK
jgi:putative hydrolase